MDIRKSLFISVAALVLASCAPKPAPQPILPEPAYDKFGNVEIPPQVCVPDGQRPVPGTANRPPLPSCQSRCVPGTELDGRHSGATHATSVRPLCVPVPGRQGQDRPSSGIPGRRGN